MGVAKDLAANEVASFRAVLTENGGGGSSLRTVSYQESYLGLLTKNPFLVGIKNLMPA